MRLIFVFPVLLIALSLRGASHEKPFLRDLSNLPLGGTALTLACIRGDMKGVTRLIKQGMKVTELDLMHARKTTNPAVIRVVETAHAVQQARHANLTHMLQEWSTPSSK